MHDFLINPIRERGLERFSGPIEGFEMVIRSRGPIAVPRFWRFHCIQQQQPEGTG